MPKINISDDALGDSLADGRYHVIFSDGETKETSDTSKHPNNDYWNAEMTVLDGPSAGRKDWVNIMLPPYELYTLGNLLQAMGMSKEEIKAGPEVELFEDELEDKKKGVFLIGKEFIVKVTTKTKNDQENRNHRFSPFVADEWNPDEEDAGGLP